MMLEKDLLYMKIEKHRGDFQKEGKKHSALNRRLWVSSTAVSVLVALGTNFTFQTGSISSNQLAAGLAILLPALTAYTVLRSPEQLWILETSMRNRLADLRTQMEFAYQRDPDFDRKPMEDAFLQLMKEANEAWTGLKKGS